MIYFILIVLLLLFIGTVVPKILWDIKRPDDGNGDVDEHGSDSEENNGDSDEGQDDYMYGNHEEDEYRRRRHYREKNMDGEDDSSEGEGTVACSTPAVRGKPSVGSRNGQHQRRLSTLQHQRLRFTSGMDLVQGSRAYSLLMKRYEREGWCFRFNIPKQWQLWKSFEILAYNICQHRSGYIYKNPSEMERLFGVKQHIHSRRGVTVKSKKTTYAEYNALCMRNLLYHMSHVHFSAFFVLLVISVLPVLYPDYDHWIFIGVGVTLLLVNIVIFFKVLHILKGIVDDRLHVLTNRDIQQLMDRSFERRTGITSGNSGTSTDNNGRGFVSFGNGVAASQLKQRQRPTLRVVAQSVRAIIRMQMSALCHRQLHFHNDRFWFNCPLFLLRLFHFATIGQAFYLVWFTLVEWQTVAQHGGAYLIPIMVLLPVVALCVITPMTMPSLVLVMSLTGIFVDLNTTDPESGYQPTQTETKTHIRLMRRSYLRSHYTEDESMIPPPPSPLPPTPQKQVNHSKAQQQYDVQQSIGRGNINDMPPPSPSSVFLRMYDSQSAVIQHNKQKEPESPRRRRTASFNASPTGRQRWSFLDNRNDDVGLLNVNHHTSEDDSTHHHEDPSTTFAPVSSPGYGRSNHRRSFDLTSYHALATHHSPRKSSLNLTSPHAMMTYFKPTSVGGSATAAEVAEPAVSVQSPTSAAAAFKSYCSKYGGYPET